MDAFSYLICVKTQEQTTDESGHILERNAVIVGLWVRTTGSLMLTFSPHCEMHF